eukprot:CAMPEP_0113943622 /NCGR_PEP_ID=MMETSP1339-20121228/26932_1 /TAXON_ID=94617 /ORGANISM="Fibrocapsa japonica" /LENGTH=342 /DNA_ID=CAMNT_0000948553 /DNA_START=75 /DNA_END=1106 /DNA_ORIENTATION=+ /assembly_acc=CAM_ASM_000762
MGLKRTLKALASRLQRTRSTPDHLPVEKARPERNLTDGTCCSEPDDFIDAFDLVNLMRIGEGSFCQVFSADFHGERVAVKVARSDVNLQKATRMLHNEARTLKWLDHIGIVRYIGQGWTESEHSSSPLYFFVMEMVAGGSLSDFLKGTETCCQDAATSTSGIEYALQLAQVMLYLHENADPVDHILHRDLKPENIGISHDGHLKLFDFGLSKAIPKSRFMQDGIKMTGDVGTLRYMAPEVALSKKYNEKAEVYSFGMILWQILSHRKPFDHIVRADEYFEYVFKGGLIPHIDEGWPSDLQNLLQACWNKDPQDRPSFAEVVSVFEAIMDRAGESEVGLHFTS